MTHSESIRSIAAAGGRLDTGVDEGGVKKMIPKINVKMPVTANTIETVENTFKRLADSLSNVRKNISYESMR